MIRFPEASELPGRRWSGPETWSQAWRKAATATDDVQRYIENSNAEHEALARAYDRRVEALRSTTGHELKNPLRSYSDADREMGEVVGANSTAGMSPALYPEYYRRKEAEFNEAARNIPGQHLPDIDAILARPIMQDAQQVMRDAERAASDANASPELWMFGRFSAGLAGGLMGAARDPVQWAMSGFGVAGAAGKTVAGRIGQTMVTEAMLNGGQELVLQGISQERKRAAGLDHGMQDMLANAGLAATFGALFGGAVQGGAELARIYRLGDGGEAIAARVIEGKPQPGDVETVARAMNIDLGPEKLDLINRSFEERVLDDFDPGPDASPAQLRLREAAERFADDPDNNMPPEMVERLLADQEFERSLYPEPDRIQRALAGDRNAIDDIAETFFAEPASSARLARVESDIARLADDIADQRIRPDQPAEPLDDAGMLKAEALAGEIVEPRIDANGNPESWFDFLPFEDGNGGRKPISPVEALQIADEQNFHADLLQACKL